MSHAHGNPAAFRPTRVGVPRDGRPPSLQATGRFQPSDRRKGDLAPWGMKFAPGGSQERTLVPWVMRFAPGVSDQGRRQLHPGRWGASPRPQLPIDGGATASPGVGRDRGSPGRGRTHALRPTQGETACGGASPRLHAGSRSTGGPHGAVRLAALGYTVRCLWPTWASLLSTRASRASSWASMSTRSTLDRARSYASIIA